VLLVVFIGALAGGYYGYSNFFNRPTVVAPTGQPTDVTRRTIVATASASGVVGSQAVTRVQFRSNGILESLPVTVGQRVEAGEVIAKLVTTDLEFAVRRAEIDLANAQTRFNALYNGPTAADIQAANASVTQAQTALAKALSDKEVLLTPPQTAELASARVDLEQKRIDLQLAQAAYDRVSWRNDVGITPEAGALEKATNAYMLSQSNYELRTAGPTAAAVENADRAIENARASLSSAQARLAQLLAGPQATDVALQTNSIETARMALEQAKNNLEAATLRAPISGSISEIRFQPGEAVTGNLLTIVDLQRLKVDVNVDETNVARLRVGQRANVTFDALQGLQVAGVVAAIAPAAVTNQGVSAFPVTINLEQAEGVRPGMNATVVVTTDTRENVVAVPNRAIRSQGRDRVVMVIDPVTGATSPRVVRTGLANDQFTEILSGLEAGEKVMVQTAVTTANRTSVPGQPGAGGAIGGFGGGGAPGGGFAIPKN
jgi:RND family efflux transporter MFP subunit